MRWYLWATAPLARWLFGFMNANVVGLRNPDFQVTKKGGEVVYLNRWWMWRRNGWCNLYLHQMLGPDDAALHDHPYWSLSLILADGINELFQLDPPTGRVKMRALRTGQLVWRSSTMAHRLDPVQPGMTLFLTGPRVRDWGFYCPQGWRRWQDYVKTTGAVQGAGGSTEGVGCGEH
jgi:hypothetical protein